MYCRLSYVKERCIQGKTTDCYMIIRSSLVSLATTLTSLTASIPGPRPAGFTLKWLLLYQFCWLFCAWSRALSAFSCSQVSISQKQLSVRIVLILAFSNSRCHYLLCMVCCFRYSCRCRPQIPLWQHLVLGWFLERWHLRSLEGCWGFCLLVCHCLARLGYCGMF